MNPGTQVPPEAEKGEGTGNSVQKECSPADTLDLGLVSCGRQEAGGHLSTQSLGEAMGKGDRQGVRPNG